MNKIVSDPPNPSKKLFPADSEAIHFTYAVQKPEFRRLI
jgi:hypothetical protein